MKHEQQTLPSCETCTFRKASLCAPTDDGQASPLSRLRKEVQVYKAGAHVGRIGEPQPLLRIIRSGWAFTAAQLTDGRRQILAFLVPGDALNLKALMLPEAPTPSSARALTDLEVCTYPLAAARELIDRTPELRSRVTSMLSDFIAAKDRRLADIGQRSTPGRMAQLLIEIHRRLNAENLVTNDAFTFPPRQEHLADALGVTPVHINRTLMSLRKSGVIELEGKAMRILDHRALKAIADDQ